MESRQIGLAGMSLSDYSIWILKFLHLRMFLQYYQKMRTLAWLIGIKECLGQKVFEWDQALDEVNMYITLRKGVPTKLIYCKIQSTHVKVGIKGNPPYMNRMIYCTLLFKKGIKVKHGHLQ
ncbi:hypothetical protein L1887_04572 [Cichorium endivia]|nr:hypothetical protein L1887_04572 [Cichorium endivia]